jgi:acetyl esterase/lipase
MNNRRAITYGFLTGVIAFGLAIIGWTADAPQRKKQKDKVVPADSLSPKATLAEVRYGTHERQVLDFWKASSDKPTPLVFFIHGGGWRAGSKEAVRKMINIEEVLAAGISVVSINYRYAYQAVADGVKPPVKAPLSDAARALQFVRSKAGEWNIDKSRIGASGGSAGACSSLWLAFHDDLADLKSSDPVSRESTRLRCAAVMVPQTTLDPQQMKEWTPNSKYGGHAFGLVGFPEFLAAREKILPWIAEYSPYALVTADDPPIYMCYPAPPAMGQDQKDPTHTANFGVKLQEKCKTVGIACELVYPGAPAAQHATPQAYLIDALVPTKPNPGYDPSVVTEKDKASGKKN